MVSHLVLGVRVKIFQNVNYSYQLHINGNTHGSKRSLAITRGSWHTNHLLNLRGNLKLSMSDLTLPMVTWSSFEHILHQKWHFLCVQIHIFAVILSAYISNMILLWPEDHFAESTAYGFDTIDQEKWCYKINRACKWCLKKSSKHKAVFLTLRMLVSVFVVMIRTGICAMKTATVTQRVKVQHTITLVQPRLWNTDNQHTGTKKCWTISIYQIGSKRCPKTSYYTREFKNKQILSFNSDNSYS